MFLSSFFAQYSAVPPNSRPHLTVTYAQSIDAKIAANKHAQLVLSGVESMRLTHRMRAIHDAILVGIDTAIADDPQLNTRHLAGNHTNPRPIILDTHLRLPTTCKLLKNFNAGIGLQPWIIYHDRPELLARKSALLHAGAILINLDTLSSQHLPIPAVLQKLRDLGVRSLMVEGGARVIASFFECHLQSLGGSGSGGSGGGDGSGNDGSGGVDSAVGGVVSNGRVGVIDSVVVTIAPVFVGDDGVGVSLPAPPAFKHVFTEVVGPDSVLGLHADLS